MTGRFAGKVAVMTGASSVIGRFAAGGAAVALAK
jgi:NAD(P)-dependent dehydrogenase (short-subunit alcohol dehydrogenase family)